MDIIENIVIGCVVDFYIWQCDEWWIVGSMKVMDLNEWKEEEWLVKMVEYLEVMKRQR